MLRVFWAVLLTVVLAAGEQTFKVDVDLVTVHFTVRSPKGRLITGLDRDAFAVFEDGQVQNISHFSRETDVPLTIVLLIDISGSVRDKLHFEKQAAVEFLHATLRPGRDEAAVATFEYTVELRQDYTDDSAMLAASLESVMAGGGTRMYDALHFVIEKKLSGPEERKVIVVISDGKDQSSIHSARDVVDIAYRNSVSIYAISTNAFGSPQNVADPKADQQPDAMLNLLAAETGGTAFFPKKVEKLASIFRKLADELRSQYTLAYRSTNHMKDGTFRKIAIQADKGRYLTRARAGYYAPTQILSQGADPKINRPK